MPRVVNGAGDCRWQQRQLSLFNVRPSGQLFRVWDTWCRLNRIRKQCLVTRSNTRQGYKGAAPHNAHTSHAIGLASCSPKTFTAAHFEEEVLPLTLLQPSPVRPFPPPGIPRRRQQDTSLQHRWPPSSLKASTQAQTSYSSDAASQRSPSAAASLQAHEPCKLSSMARCAVPADDPGCSECRRAGQDGHAVHAEHAEQHSHMPPYVMNASARPHHGADIQDALMQTRWCGCCALLPLNQHTHLPLRESTTGTRARTAPGAPPPRARRFAVQCCRVLCPQPPPRRGLVPLHPQPRLARCACCGLCAAGRSRVTG